MKARLGAASRSPRRWRTRQWLPIVVAGLVLVGAAGLWSLGAGGGEEVGPSERGWVAVERRDLVLETEISGELQAVHSSNYGPPIVRRQYQFKISFLAPEGAVVEAGTPILGFDTSELERLLLRAVADRDSALKSLEKRATDLDIESRRARLELAEARAKLRRAGLEADVPEELRSRQKARLAAIELKLAEAELRHREGHLVHLEAAASSELSALRQEHRQQTQQVEALEEQIEKMTVRARQAGTVLYHSRNGNKKKVGDTCYRQELVVEIPDLRKMKAVVEASEASAGRLAVGQPVRFSLDAHPDHTYRATVEKIHRTVSQRSWRDRRRVVRLEVGLEETDVERMRPGMRLEGSVEVERVEDALTLPIDALVLRPQGAVVRVKGAWSGWVTPELGRRNDRWVEVLDGLEEGAQVLTGAE